MNICALFSNLISDLTWITHIIHPPISPKPHFFYSLSFHRREVIWHSKLIFKEDWWLTIDVSILSRQQHFLQLCWEYKHDCINNGRITNTIKRRGRRLQRQVMRMELTKEDRWQQFWTVEDLMVSIVRDIRRKKTQIIYLFVFALSSWCHWVSGSETKASDWVHVQQRKL